jgi:hypothetical protein
LTHPVEFLNVHAKMFKPGRQPPPMPRHPPKQHDQATYPPVFVEPEAPYQKRKSRLLDIREAHYQGVRGLRCRR